MTPEKPYQFLLFAIIMLKRLMFYMVFDMIITTPMSLYDFRSESILLTRPPIENIQ